MTGCVSGRRRAQGFDISPFGSSTTFLGYGRRVESSSGRTGCNSIRCRPAICGRCIFRICTIFLASCSPLLMYRSDFPVPSSNLPLPPAIKRISLDIDYDIGHGRTVSLVTCGPMSVTSYAQFGRIGAYASFSVSSLMFKPLARVEPASTHYWPSAPRTELAAHR